MEGSFRYGGLEANVAHKQQHRTETVLTVVSAAVLGRAVCMCVCMNGQALREAKLVENEVVWKYSEQQRKQQQQQNK